MKKHTVLFISLLLVFSVTGVFAQQGFTGPHAFTGQSAGFTGQQGFHGYTGMTTPVTVAQVVQTFPNKAHALLKGNIVQHLGGDRYLFRDSSGDVVMKIKHDRWWGLSVSPSDLVEIGGQLKREKNGWIKYFDGKSIRMAQ